MAITNKYTLEKMKKKNPKSIRVEKPKKKLTFTDATKKNVPGTPIVPKESKPEHLGEKGFKLKFGDAFRIAKKDGKKVFTWKGKKYTTQTKAELEAGKSEKAKFERKGKSNVKADKSKKGIIGKLNEKIRSFRKKTTGFSTQAEYESARDKRRIEKRISKMKERKNQGKSYSAKNLAELEAKLK
tara:strand:- start:35 stop:586 length:552 start_codon:yes stop_codon:yes gene_type:complete